MWDVQEDREPEPEQQFARRVREAREGAGMSQAQLAEQLSSYGISLDATGITRLEKGRRMIRLNEAVALAEILGIEVAHLVQIELPRTREALLEEAVRLQEAFEQLKSEADEVGAEAIRARSRETELVRRLGYLRARLAWLHEAAEELRREPH